MHFDVTVHLLTRQLNYNTAVHRTNTVLLHMLTSTMLWSQPRVILLQDLLHIYFNRPQSLVRLALYIHNKLYSITITYIILYICTASLAGCVIKKMMCVYPCVSVKDLKFSDITKHTLCCFLTCWNSSSTAAMYQGEAWDLNIKILRNVHYSVCICIPCFLPALGPTN